MTNVNNNGPHSKPIKPATIPLSKVNADITKNIPWQQKRGTIITLGFIFFMALIVIFVLPYLIDGRTEIKPETKDRKTSSLKEAPFLDAQLLKARRESQDSLSKFLARQDFLERKNVQLWGKEAFEEALKTGSDGDFLYRKRSFNEALILYEKALAKLAELEGRIPEELLINIKLAKEAFSLGNATEAQKYYELALSIDSSSTIAKQGLDRTYVLNEVLTLVKEANRALEEENLEQAKKLFLVAINLDPLNQESINGSIVASQLIADKMFISAMSSGYQALEDSIPSKAIKAFQEALRIQPKSSTAFSGLTQAQSLLIQKKIKAQLSNAALQETKEQWHLAANNYKNILAENNSLIEAQLGQKRSKKREHLSDAINIVLATPLRLSSIGVYEHAKELLESAKKVQLPGPGHTEQINQLVKELEMAKTLLLVAFRSDNSTKVTLLKNSMLGTFKEKKLLLKPGNYIATGSREGYRDVRIEFKVTPKEGPFSIEIACREPI
jgi:tetratricopeptide (TPR) repeat protein